MEYKLYILTNKVNLKRYIGWSTNPIHRWGNGKGYQKNQPRIHNAIKKYGWENFSHEIRLICSSKEEVLEREQYYIKLFRSNDPRFGYNTSLGGESGNFKGKDSLSEEYRREQCLKSRRKHREERLKKSYTFNHSEKGKESSNKWNHSEAGIAAHKRYYLKKKAEKDAEKSQ